LNYSGNNSINLPRKKLAILTNLIAPYRVPIYLHLAKRFDTLLLHGGTEPNRHWKTETLPSLKTRKVWTLQIPTRKHTGVPGISDTAYLHLSPGLLFWLLFFRPDVVLTNEMGLRTAIALIYGKLAGAQVWVWWGGTPHSEKHANGWRRGLRRFLACRVKHWISYGATSTEYLESLGIPRHSVLQIQNCVPQETFLKIPDEHSSWFERAPHPVIVAVGQFTRRKGLNKLIEACGRFTARGLDFTLAIVGDGPERNRLVAMARENAIEHFQMIPNQPQAAMNEIYRAADVVVFPTMEDVWGLVVNEAMWAGTPVLCSKYAGCATELLPESNIFDPLSPESFDAALAKIFSHSVSLPDRSRLRTWQEMSRRIARSLAAGYPCNLWWGPTGSPAKG
jgi:glycosyltransferase involved in cell wall biosynthesis